MAIGSTRGSSINRVAKMTSDKIENPTRTALICGVTGQDGALLSRFLLGKSYRVAGTSRDAQVSTFGNLKKLGVEDQVEKESMILTDFRNVLQILDKVQPDEIYNLAGQSSVGLSFQQPVETLESVTLGTLNLLEAVRFLRRPIRIYQASSSECFGDTGGQAANEQTPFYPRSPYAVAKAAAHWEVINYREAYDLYACNGILFNHESPLRPARFVTRKIVQTACDIAKGRRNELCLGNLEISRDWGWAEEYVEAMWKMLQQDTPDDFIIATGVTQSLRDFVEATFAELGLDWQRHVRSDPTLLRPSDLLVSRADPSKAARELGWRATVDMRGVVRRMVQAESDEAAHK